MASVVHSDDKYLIKAKMLKKKAIYWSKKEETLRSGLFYLDACRQYLKSVDYQLKQGKSRDA